MERGSVADTTLGTIGRTPVVRLMGVVPPDFAEVVIKLEAFNPTGSYKDRMALAMVEGAERRGELRPGMMIVEYTGGSTAGVLVGVSRALRAGGSRDRIVALEPASIAVISTGVAGRRHGEGLGVGFVPPLLAADAYDDARGIDEGEARRMARRLAREEGVFAGTSTGLNVVGALQLAREIGPGGRVATVARDSGLKYLQGDLFEIG